MKSSYPIVANLPSGRQVRNKQERRSRRSSFRLIVPYSMLIGIAGQNGATVGDFDLKVEVKAR